MKLDSDGIPLRQPCYTEHNSNSTLVCDPRAPCTSSTAVVASAGINRLVAVDLDPTSRSIPPPSNLNDNLHRTSSHQPFLKNSPERRRPPERCYCLTEPNSIPPFSRSLKYLRLVFLPISKANPRSRSTNITSTQKSRLTRTMQLTCRFDRGMVGKFFFFLQFQRSLYGRPLPSKQKWQNKFAYMDISILKSKIIKVNKSKLATHAGPAEKKI